MNIELLDLLRCPKSGGRLILEEADWLEGRVSSGRLRSQNGEHRYEIRNFIPRFVPDSNYSDNFGIQWNKFRDTQLDSHSGYPISAERFWKATDWRPEDLADKWVLDAGCGAGRFAEIALNAGAKVVALDYSRAVDACRANLSSKSACHIVQGDVYALPFAKRAFSFVYSLGVLQHTPDPKGAFAALPGMLGGGGRLCIDFYERSWKSLLLPKYWLRPLTSRMSNERLFDILQSVVPKFFPLTRWMGQMPLGHVAKRLIPVADPVYFFERTHPGVSMPIEQRLEWSLLDTFDWLSPKFDHPQTAAAIAAWMSNAGLERIEVLKAGHLVGRGTMPLRS